LGASLDEAKAVLGTNRRKWLTSAALTELETPPPR
jgi:hypothetical protein